MKPYKTSTYPAEVKNLIGRNFPQLYFKSWRDLLMRDHKCHLVDMKDICVYI